MNADGTGSTGGTDEAGSASALDAQVSDLMAGCEFGDRELEAAMGGRLRDRLERSRREGRPLRVYAGYDPSAPDLHLGHSITLRKLRQFQRLGHDVTVVVGTVTATLGDTSDRPSARPRKSHDEVAAAAATYGEQVFTVLDRDRTAVVENGDWLAPLRLPQVLDLASQFTVQQFLARDNYRRRIARGEPVGLHEFLYALLQGYDAVHLRADVQLGATEQLFNILAGGKLQEAWGQEPCVALTFPILVGVDGVERMSKSRGNYVGLTEPPGQQFGKIMSISDDTMLAWAGLVTDWDSGEVEVFREAVRTGAVHPMVAKKRLAAEVVGMYHGAAAASRAREEFEAVHQRGDVPEEAPEVSVPGAILVVDLLLQTGAASSKSGARRLIEGGGVAVDGQRLLALDAVVSPPATVRVGRRRFYRVVAS